MDYICKVATTTGQVLDHVEKADSETEVRQRLAAQGYCVFSIQPKDWLRARVDLFRRRKIRPDDFVIFNQQFLTLSKSGLPLQKSLELLARQARSPELRAGLEAVRDEVRAGALLSDAFAATGRFPKIYSANVRAGERSGSLDRVLSQYLSYQKISRSFRKKIVAALIYPGFLVFFLIVLVSFVVSFIVPRFAMLYGDLGVELPHITQITIAAALGVRHVALEIFIALIAGAFGLRAAWRSTRVRMAWDRVRFHLPLVGPLLLKFSVAEFARTLSTLLQGGLPVVESLETARASITSPLIAKAIEDAKREVTGGRSLSLSLRATGLFPPTAIDMVEVGETTGALPAMLESVAEFYEEDVSIDLSTLVALVDPVMIAGVAIVVAFVLVAFYLPLFSLAAQVH
ncbi:MAG: type II secretion system F family protein [Candidatus Acidiferrales bacterium]